MSLKKSLLLTAAVTALAVASLSGCASVATDDVKTTSTSAADSNGWSFSVDGKDTNLASLPSDIPFLTDYNEAKATGDQATGDFQLALKTGRTNAVKDAGTKLVGAGFTAKGTVYTTTKWKVTLEGTSGQVHYTIAKNS
jgi:uncharacterized protein YceK